MNPEIGRILIIAGLVILAAGLLIYFGGDKLRWLGNLPGDIRIERERTRFYFPITTMILISILATVVIHLIRRFF